jgi:uncharacterized protein
MRCRYCYAAPHRGGDMTTETAQAAVRLAVETAAREDPGQGVGVIFFGGEPLLQRGLISETAAYCQGLAAAGSPPFHFKVTTNGLLLDAGFLTAPHTRDILVALSHDGVQPAHDCHRVDAAGAGTFERLSPVVDVLLAHQPYSPAMAVVTPATVGHYADSVRYLFERGFRYLIFSLDYGAQWTDGHMRELRRQYNRIAEWYYRETVNEAKFYFSPFEVKIASHVFPGSCLRDRCELGRRQVSVAPSGRIYPCVQFVGDGEDDTYAIGHVGEGIDEAARQRLYDANAEEKPSCTTCAVRERCNHFCGCLNRQATGSLRRVSPVLCAHERIVLPIVDKLAGRLFDEKRAIFVQKHYNELYLLLSLVEDAVSAREGK